MPPSVAILAKSGLGKRTETVDGISFTGRTIPLVRRERQRQVVSLTR